LKVSCLFFDGYWIEYQIVPIVPLICKLNLESIKSDFVIHDF
jgi:hypothetical protein